MSSKKSQQRNSQKRNEPLGSLKGEETPTESRTVRTLGQARSFVLKRGICGIFSYPFKNVPSLWDVVDLPDRQPGEKGWSQRVLAIWAWKDELPAKYPDEIFYGKVPGGKAALMSIDYLRSEHYPKHWQPLENCTPLAIKIYQLIKYDPMTNRQLRRELGMENRVDKSRFDRALQELQVTLNIVRRNNLEDETDTWVLFSDQYLELVKEFNEE